MSAFPAVAASVQNEPRISGDDAFTRHKTQRDEIRSKVLAICWFAGKLVVKSLTLNPANPRSCVLLFEIVESYESPLGQSGS